MRSKIMVLAILVSGVIMGAVALLGCGPEPSTEYDLSWLKYQKKDGLDPKRDELGTYLSHELQSSKSALAKTETTDLKYMQNDELEGVHNICNNYFKWFNPIANDEEEKAFKTRCNEVSGQFYAGTVSSALTFEDDSDSEFGVIYGAMEGEVAVIPEIGAIWGKAAIEMTEVQQGIAGALDVVGGVVQGVTNRVLCLTELGVRVLPEISQGLLDDYGSGSAEGACKLGCVTNAALPAALWCMAYPENFGSNSEFDPDTLWQEIDSYLHATCDDITAQNGCVPYY